MLHQGVTHANSSALQAWHTLSAERTTAERNSNSSDYCLQINSAGDDSNETRNKTRENSLQFSQQKSEHNHPMYIVHCTMRRPPYHLCIGWRHCLFICLLVSCATGPKRLPQLNYFMTLGRQRVGKYFFVRFLIIRSWLKWWLVLLNRLTGCKK